jgi:hypothetical protein
LYWVSSHLVSYGRRISKRAARGYRRTRAHGLDQLASVDVIEDLNVHREISCKQERLPKSRHARTIKRLAEAKVTRQTPSQRYRQKPPDSRTVVKTAATYERNPAKVAHNNFTRIAESVVSEHRKIRSCAGGRVSVFVFIGKPWHRPTRTYQCI